MGSNGFCRFSRAGIHIRPIAAEAHYQLGKTETHGGWFERILNKKVLDERQPVDKPTWLECVRFSHVKSGLSDIFLDLEHKACL